MRSKTFHLISLGCAKNTVDSDSMAYLLQHAGYKSVHKPSQADILIVNTCGFIQPAVQESLETLNSLARQKRPNQKLIAAGCLSQRARQMIVEQVSGIDGILSTRRWTDIVELAEELRGGKTPLPKYDLPENPTANIWLNGVPRAAIQAGSAYLKIADGCRRPCAFCTIPLIKGTTRSRPLVDILTEAAALQQKGVRELVLIAQDTTDYGHDLGMKEGLAQTLEALVRSAPHIPWIRVLYAYPGCVSDRLISVIATHDQILPYLDLPLQHAHPDVLRRMNRPANVDWVRRTLDKMRHAMPDLALRTTFIVGYPGETDREFQTLLDFIQEIQFDRVGVFPFFMESGTPSESLGDTVPLEVKTERLEILMVAQQQISLNRNQSFIGKTLDVLVEGYDKGISVARSYRDAPEIDGLVLIEGKVKVGEIVPVRINGAMTHDLSAQLL
ncbi:MAG: 30S ribosomal protein S12 methylthiotransferase RimO [Anaerolineaceae bacterium]|nr:30S ribosomal protein S12 methylthiotransferase RimO [Anaerolineaceae bacterium]